MDRTRAWRAILIALLLVLLGGCSSTSELAELHGYAAQPQSTQGPLCERSPFGEYKRGEVAKTVVVTATEPIAIALDDHLSDSGKLQVLSQRLERLPPEIARIRRGLVNSFTGKFIKDGLFTWAGVDLDRLMAVSVQRRVFDLRAHQSRPVSDPVFTRVEQLSFARKWSDGQRIEVEVIEVFPITLIEAQSFVCEANRLWADKKPLPEEEDVSGQMSDGVTDVFLFDYRQQQGVSYKYTKPALITESMANILGGVWRHAPQGPSW